MLSTLFRLNHWNEALQLYRKILYFVKKHFKDNSRLILVEMDNYVAFLYLDLGMQEEANEVQHKILKHCEKHFGHYSE